VTPLPRSHYEFGDPVHEAIGREEHSDHYRARARGQRVLLLADRLVIILQAQALLTDPDVARRKLFHALADDLYGNGALDVPDFTSEQSLDALRRGSFA
jgi:hypothetical protein